jgi:hypothetical protein
MWMDSDRDRILNGDRVNIVIYESETGQTLAQIDWHHLTYRPRLR